MFRIIATCLLLSISTFIFSQKKPKVYEYVDEFEGYRVVQADKKAGLTGFVQMSVKIIITDNNTLVKVSSNIINNGGILDKSKPYFVILSNNHKYKLQILYASTPKYFMNNQYMTTFTFKIPNDLISEFSNNKIVKARIYYIDDTYEEISGGALSTSLTDYLSAVNDYIQNK